MYLILNLLGTFTSSKIDYLNIFLSITIFIDGENQQAHEDDKIENLKDI